MDKFLDLIEALDGKRDSLSLAEIEQAIDLFEMGLSGELVARILCGELEQFSWCGVGWHCWPKKGI